MRPPDAAFFFDLASPLAYLAAEQVLQALPGPAEWRPVLAAGLPDPSPIEGLRCESEYDALRESVALRARALGLQELRWPEQFPFDSELAMRAATYAKSIGRTVPFAQAAFRQAFAGGRSLQDPENLLIAAAACEIHPSALLSGTELRSVRERLRESTAAAADLGVREVPAVWVAPPRAGRDEPREAAERVSAGESEGRPSGRLFEGERLLDKAAAYMRASSRAGAEVAR
jgi:2-hydroxychromene-2-carboxylate isomerase